MSLVVHGFAPWFFGQNYNTGQDNGCRRHIPPSARR
jgi:hypothetical protein